MVNLEIPVIQVILANQEIPVFLVQKETGGLQESLAKMVLMETNAIALSALMYMHMMDNLATQENQEDVENLDREDPLENQVITPSATLENMVKMVNPESLETLEKMVHLENPASMVNLEITLM